MLLKILCESVALAKLYRKDVWRAEQGKRTEKKIYIGCVKPYKRGRVSGGYPRHSVAFVYRGMVSIRATWMSTMLWTAHNSSFAVLSSDDSYFIRYSYYVSYMMNPLTTSQFMRYSWENRKLSWVHENTRAKHSIKSPVQVQWGIKYIIIEKQEIGK